MTQIQDALKDKGVYGIYVEDKLIYIGSTISSFKSRWNKHKENLNNLLNNTLSIDSFKGCKELYLFLIDSIKQEKRWYFKILFDSRDIRKCCHVIKKDKINDTIRDVETNLIARLNPICNVRDNYLQNACFYPNNKGLTCNINKKHFLKTDYEHSYHYSN